MKTLLIKLAKISVVLIVGLIAFPLISKAQKREIPPKNVIFSSNVPRSVNLVDCTPSTLTGNLVFNPAFNTNATYDPSHWDNPFAWGHIDYWSNAFSTPNFDFPGAPPPYPTIHAAFMSSTYAGGQVYSEGLIGKLSPLVAGNEYSLTFYLNNINSIPDNVAHAYNIYLMHCSDVPLYFPNPNTQFLLPPLPPNSQRIFCETNTGFTNWHQESVCFIPNQDYDMILIFPAVEPLPTTPDYTNYTGFAYPEIVSKSDFNITINTPDPGNPCIKILSPSYAVSNATYQWYLNGNLFSTLQTPQINTSSQFGTVTLQVTLPTAGTNSTCGLPSCALSATLNILECITGCPQPVVTPGGPIDYYSPLDAAPYGTVLTSSFATGNQWYRNNVPISGATGQTFTIDWSFNGSNIDGTYTTKVNGCTSNPVVYTSYYYGYGWYGEEEFHFGAKMHPVNSSNYYCKNTADKIRLFDLGPSATYSWSFHNYANPGSPTNISLNMGTYDPHSPIADVNIGGGSNISELVRGVAATTTGAQKIIDYYLWQSPLVYPWIGTTIQACQNMTIDIMATSGTFYTTWFNIPGSSKFNLERYEFGPNTTLVNPLVYSSYVVSSNPLIIEVPGNNPQPQPIKVQFAGPSYIHKTFTYTSAIGGCAKEDYNVVAWFPGCLFHDPEDPKKDDLSLIYPNPASNQITVTSKYAINQIEISDLMNPTLKLIKANKTKTVTLNVFDLKPGVYNCKILTSNGIENQKLIVTR